MEIAYFDLLTERIYHGFCNLLMDIKVGKFGVGEISRFLDFLQWYLQVEG